MKKVEVVKVLELIMEDMKNDAKNFDGKPFTGRTVAEYLGYQGAAISALAGIIKELIQVDEYAV